MQVLIKTTILLFLVLFQSCCFTPFSGMFRTQSYLLPANLKSHWITIEYENPDCPPLAGGVFSQEIVIPQSGFLCTSSSMYSDWHQRKYFLVSEQGERTLLKTQEQIWSESSFSRAKELLPDGKERCSFKGEEFFYGSRSDVTENNPIMEDAAFLQYHSDCKD